MPRIWILALLLACALHAQSFPLESVVLQGTTLPKGTIVEIAGLKIGAPIDKDGMDAACGKLRDSGLFTSIGYRYAPGPKKGYILTLTLEDQKSLVEAVIDLPGIDEAELWRWLTAKYPPFDRRVPASGAAQDFLAATLADHLKTQIEGQRIEARSEIDLSRNRDVTAFELANLPRIAAMNFAGQKEFTPVELAATLQKMVADRGYTDRGFRQIVEANLRGMYEEHGMYRVQFPTIAARKSGPGAVEVTTTIEEGPRFTLGDLQFTGDQIPLDEIRKAVKLKKGQTANWAEIQAAIWDSERPVRRTGYFNAAPHSERTFHDDTLVLDVKVSYTLGPLFHTGELSITGLIPSQEAQARKMWKLHPGDPYDFLYPADFFRAFLPTIDARQFKKWDAKTQMLPGNVVNFTLVFEPK